MIITWQRVRHLAGEAISVYQVVVAGVSKDVDGDVLEGVCGWIFEHQRFGGIAWGGYLAGFIGDDGRGNVI